MANRFLNNIKINDAYTLPSTVGTTGQYIKLTDAGTGATAWADLGQAAEVDTISYEVRNETGSSIPIGSVVYINGGSGSSDHVTIALSDASSEATSSKTFGVTAETIANNSTGKVILEGIVEGVDTSNFSPGQTLWLSTTAGAFDNVIPTTPDHAVFIGYAVRCQQNNGTIFVKIQNGYEIEELHNVKITSVADNDLLSYNSTLGYWENVSLPATDITSTDVSHWDAAYAWGDHSSFGYLTTETDPLFASSAAFGITSTNVSNWNTAYNWGDHSLAGYLTSYTETDPVFTASSAAGITSTDILNWDTAYGWGDHSIQGYLTSYVETDTLSSVTGRGATTTDSITIGGLHVNSTGAVEMPAGTTAERPTGVAGMFRFNSEDSQFEGYNGTEWGAIAGSGGGGTVTIEKNVYTGDNSTVAFNTSTSIVNENNVQVYIDGVYQSKDNYTTSGSTVTFSTAPPSSTSVELIHMVAVSGVVARDSFTGDGSTVNYVLSMSISNENATQVYVDGVYQSKNNYTTSGSTLTFSTPPPSGVDIEVVHIKAVDASSLNQNSFTGDGSTTQFTLSQSIDDENKTFVFIQGLYQEKDTYSLDGTTLTFSTAPSVGHSIEVMAFSTITISNQSKYSVSVISSNTNAAANTLYVLTANLTLTLPASPSDGDSIKISNRSGVATCVIARNGQNIMGSASDLTIDKLNSGFELIYAGSAQGWILIGVEGTP